MKIKLRVGINSSTERHNLNWVPYSKENRAFLIQFPNAVFNRCTKHNMNYYKLPNGFLVHVYHCYEVE